MQDRASRTRQAILRAAAASFEARGYVGTRLDDVVAGRDISKGALYFHFPSKEALAVAVVREQFDMWPTVISRLREQHPRAIRVLVELSWQVARTLYSNVLIRAGVRLMFERDLIGPSVPSPFASWIDTVEQLLEDARAQGDLLPDVDAKESAEFVIAAFTGLHHVATQENEHADLLHYVTAMWRCVLPCLVNENCLEDISSVVTARDI